MTSTHRFCPACHSRTSGPVASVQLQDLLRCLSCGLVFERRIPSDDELAAHYSQYSYSKLRACPPATLASYQQVLHSLSPWQGKRRLLDLGCGQGDFLVEAIAARWQATGMEFSQAAVSLCRGRGLSNVHEASAARDFPANSFDVITAFEVLEHLRSPGDLFADASRLLVAGGLLYLTTPNFNALLRHLERDSFRVISYPDHLCLFSPTSLRKLAVRHGFRVAALRTTGLDPWRLQRCLKMGGVEHATVSAGLAVDAQARVELREAAYTSRRVAWLKSSVIALVNAAGVGDTTKAWLVKV